MTRATIRVAGVEDAPLILSLIKELAEYERLSHEVIATEEQLGRTLFGERRGAEVLIAEWEGEPEGFALFFHNYSTFLARQGIYLEDLYVRERARGRQVFREAQYAHECFDELERRGCLRRTPQARIASAGRNPAPLIEVHPALTGSDLSDLSEESVPETRWGNKSDKSEGPEDSHDNPDLAVEPEELDDEDRRYIEDERAGMQAEEAGTTTHIVDSLLAKGAA